MGMEHPLSMPAEVLAPGDIVWTGQSPALPKLTCQVGRKKGLGAGVGVLEKVCESTGGNLRIHMYGHNVI